MSDLISRDKVIQSVKELFSMGDSYSNELSIIRMLYNLPSIDFNKNAKIKRYFYGGTSFYDIDGECSECGKYLDALWEYCPSCGAKLEWEKWGE